MTVPEIAAVTPTIYNADTGEYLQIKGEILRGDIITISTKTGNKTVTLTRNGVDSNIINRLVAGSTSDTIQNYIYTSVTTGKCVELPFYWLYCDAFITGMTADFVSNVGIPLTLEQDPDSEFGHACDAADEGEYYLCWVGRSNNSHPVVREVKVMN